MILTIYANRSYLGVFSSQLINRFIPIVYLHILTVNNSQLICNLLLKGCKGWRNITLTTRIVNLDGMIVVRVWAHVVVLTILLIPHQHLLPRSG